MWEYNVKLVQLFSRTTKEDGSFEDIQNTSNAKIYHKPTENDWASISRESQTCDCKKDKSDTNYGFVERVKIKDFCELRIGQDIPRHKFTNHEKFHKWLYEIVPKDLAKSECPLFIINLTCLVALMNPGWGKGRITTYQTHKMSFGDGKWGIYVKHGTKEKYERANNESYSYFMENALDCCKNEQKQENKQLQPKPQKELSSTSSSSSATQQYSTKPIIVVDANRSLQAVYEAELRSTDQSGNENPRNTFKIILMAESDGIWASSSGKAKEFYVESDLVEMKCVDQTNLYSMSSKFHYEEVLLRKFFCCCRLRGIPGISCNFIAGGKLKEQWLLSVDKIPKIIAACSKKHPSTWNRAFPKSLLDKNVQEAYQKPEIGRPRIWTEEDCFSCLGSALQTIRTSYDYKGKGDHKDGIVKFFIRDALTIARHRHRQNQYQHQPESHSRSIIDQITKEESQQASKINTQLVIKFLDVLEKHEVKEMKSDQLQAKIRPILELLLGENMTPEYEAMILPPAHKVYSGGKGMENTEADQ